MTQPDPVALHDQAVEEIRQKARVVAAYWTQLIAEGVDEYEALQLTRDVAERFIFGDPTAKPDNEPEGEGT